MLHLWIDDCVIASLVTSDTVADQVFFAFSYFGDPVWICKLGASDAYQVKLAFLNDLVCHLSCIDTANSHNRDIDLLFDVVNILYVEAMSQVEWRNFIYGCE